MSIILLMFRILPPGTIYSRRLSGLVLLPIAWKGLSVRDLISTDAPASSRRLILTTPHTAHQSLLLMWEVHGRSERQVSVHSDGCNHVQGFITPFRIIDILKRLRFHHLNLINIHVFRTFLSANPNTPWAALTLLGFVDAPVSWGSKVCC
jgi:hypothetical protein